MFTRREELPVETLFKNEATWDRVLRVLVGLAMLALGLVGWLAPIWSVALVIFAWVPLLTGAFGWCPIYSILGVNTLQRLRRRPPPDA